MNYTTLTSEESSGSYGSFGVKIEVACYPTMPNLENEAIRQAAWKAREMLKSALMEVAISENKDAQEQRKQQRADLIGLFPVTVFVEEIPNGYCNQACCKHLPWFIVTTAVGRITIGWRKRVISIDWSVTIGALSADELFPNEDTTKGDFSIHAWSLEKAKEYVSAILTKSNP